MLSSMSYNAAENDPRKNPSSDLKTQFWLAFLVGSSACLFFCIFRRRWKVLYAPRASIQELKLPTLSSSSYLWLLDLIRIPDHVFQNCAGLDGYVFLLFFKMAIKFLAFTSLLGFTVIMPVNKHFRGDAFGNITFSGVLAPSSSSFYSLTSLPPKVQSSLANQDSISLQHTTNAIYNFTDIPGLPVPGDGFLYLYVIFTYIISIYLLYVLFSSTKLIADIRQSYLARQTRLADRTVFISGLPPDLCSSEALKSYLEKLDIGDVDQVNICRNYIVMDSLLSKRKLYAQKLEKYWRAYRKVCADHGLQIPNIPDDLISGFVPYNGTSQRLLSLPRGELQYRPMVRTHFFGFFGQQIDAIDFYSAKLLSTDQKIESARRLNYPATGEAFVTFESMASAQIVAQIHIDAKSLMGLHISLAPASNDIQWHHTYIGRWHRFLRSWLITLLTLMIILLWTVPVGAIAVFVNLDNISKLWPELGRLIQDVPFLNSLLRTFLPTLVYSLFISISPYLFQWLSKVQGFNSRGEEEIYSVGKNFAYLFVNFFLVYIIAGSTSYWELVKDTTTLAHFLANRLPNQAQFFIDLIVLQGIGMFPLKLIQLGKLFIYLIRRSFAKHPQDYRKLEKPDSFSIGIYLPQPMFILMICLCYSIISPLILIFGLIYFIVGFLIYKYELIYQMEHPQHSTGKLWSIIFERIIFGCLLLQLTMMGLMSLRKAYWLSTVIFPLFCFTLTSAYNFSKMIQPAMEFVSLYYVRTSQSNQQNSEISSRSSDGSTAYIHPGFVNCEFDST
ncbi:calcium ion transmembrane transporter [Schizosaccharomyces osmophilus]|uniref:Calcium ion transmembrane transporter n=1 Tax=Schizosaccharomyces osmophilus TaxID=2545709 RepID=A0AAE9WBG6_9SCHI|nr:calcium ion transmembrane transporter [Schizosaccharomyces osmophilus]WBW72177.1 calcium ion transmembrane transporter [Schizosaccharomyces osmophilus]